MRKLALLLITLSPLALGTVFAGGQPRGNLLELQSCEVYAGGCIVSCEAPLAGRYMVRAWEFTGGEFAGTDFSGLRLAVLQSASENLAFPQAKSSDAIVYLPESATLAQRGALLAWLKSDQANCRTANLQTRVVPLQFGATQKGYAFSAGNYLSVKTASLESCETGACGEALWYTPRTPTTVFTVAVDHGSRIREPLLKLTWTNAGSRSIFLAKFGDQSGAKELYVTSADLCGPAQKLF
jgi:hypothetical protein